MKADPAGEEERLLIEAAQRDPGRFAGLYERNFERVYAYVAYRVGSRAEAEDVTAEVFQKALAKLPRFEWRGVPFAAWLRRMAANAIADRRHAARRESGEPARGAGSDDDIERRAMLFQLVDTLPPDQRRVVIGRFVEQRSICEMARDFGRSEGAVKQLQLRALRSLRADRLDQLVAEMLAVEASAGFATKDRRLAPLARLAADLRDLPRPSFRASLKRDLERTASMSTTAVNPIRAGFHTITPYVTAPDAAGLIEFVKSAFGDQELFRDTGSAGGIHAEVRMPDECRRESPIEIIESPMRTLAQHISLGRVVTHEFLGGEGLLQKADELRRAPPGASRWSRRAGPPARTWRPGACR